VAAAALVEARRHFTAAIELADDDLIPDLWERLGDALQYGREAIEAYQTAHRLSREQERGPDEQLRALAGMLRVFMRYRGSVPHPPNVDEMRSLRGEAARLSTVATDERAIARYLAADSFYPFWAGIATRLEPGDLDEAEGKARRAIAMAERLGDVAVESIALDGLGSVLMLRGDQVGSREQSLKRTALRDLDLLERMDAFAVATWMSVYLGEPRDAVRISDDALRLAQPGQASAQVLHVVAWRTLALFLLGEWDQALRLGERAVALWNESGRVSAGFAMRGFVPAYQIARTRRDGPAADRLREVILAIAAAFGPDSVTGQYPALLAPDVDVDALVRFHVRAPRMSLDALERAVATGADLGRPADPSLLEQALARWEAMANVPLVAQIHRSSALARRDGAGLEQAQSEFAAMDALPFVARCRCERALLTGDRKELAAGLATLEQIGDLEQVERYEQRARARGLG
jgi:tetratricopeptide (TPR) repeat protein